MISDNQFDYACGAFIRPYTRDGNIYYAAFCPEAVPYNGALRFTGRYVVTLLHPEKGTVVFHLSIDEGVWTLESEKAGEALPDIDEDLFIWAGDQIDAATK